MIGTLSASGTCATVPDAETLARDVTEVALAAYGGIAPHAGAGGDPLAAFLAAELALGTAGDDESARFEHAARRVDTAIDSLRHVSGQLHERASTSGCLPLPLAVHPGGGAGPLRAS